jgi:hypothetical protein
MCDPSQPLPFSSGGKNHPALSMQLPLPTSSSMPVRCVLFETSDSGFHLFTTLLSVSHYLL